MRVREKEKEDTSCLRERVCVCERERECVCVRERARDTLSLRVGDF